MTDTPAPDAAVLRILLDEARLERDGMQRLAIRNRDELAAARAEVAAHEADLLKIEGQRADLAARLFAQEAELEALRADARGVLDEIDANGHTPEVDARVEELLAALVALPVPCPANTRQSPNGTAD